MYLDVTAYTWECYVYYKQVATDGGGIVTIGRNQILIFQPTVGVVNATSGSLVIGFSETQTRLLYPDSEYNWYLRWVAPGQITRTIVSGTLTARYP